MPPPTWGPPSKQLDPTMTVGGLAGESVFGFFGNSSPGPLEPRGSRFDQIERHINKQPHQQAATHLGRSHAPRGPARDDRILRPGDSFVAVLTVRATQVTTSTAR